MMKKIKAIFGRLKGVVISRVEAGLPWVALSRVVLLLMLLLWITKMQADNKYLTLTSDILIRENLTLKMELEANRAAALAREDEKERLANENAALVAAINEVYANDQNAKDWADSPCPDAVLCLLD